MSDETFDEEADDAFVAVDEWLADQLEPHAGEVRDRGLIVHRELDPTLHLRRDAEARRAFARLFRFVFTTVPDGCEVFVAAVRGESPVTALGVGVVTLRWQVVGAEPAPQPDDVAPIRPVPGGAVHHASSKAAVELVRRFDELGRRMELAAVRGDRELWAKVWMT